MILGKLSQGFRQSPVEIIGQKKIRVNSQNFH